MVHSRWVGAATCVLVVGLSVAGCGLRRGSAAAATPVQGWTAVQQLAPGQSVRVGLKGGTEVTGTVLSIATDGLVLRRRDGDHTVARNDVQLLALRERPTRRKATIGLIAGATAGALGGALAAETNRGTWIAMMSAGWGAIGALIGASDGFFDRRDTVIYRSD